MLVTMATWEFIWRESCDWRLSHCTRLTSGDLTKRGSRPAGMKSCSTSAGNTMRYAVEKVLYTGRNVAGAFCGNGMCVSGPKCCCQFIAFVHLYYLGKKKKKNYE